MQSPLFLTVHSLTVFWCGWCSTGAAFLPDVRPSTSANFSKKVFLKTLSYIEEEQGKIRAAGASREETKKKVRPLINN